MSTSRMRTTWLALALAASALGATACGSSSSSSTPASTTVPADCATLATKFSAAVAGFGTSNTPSIASVFAELDEVLPSDLRDDAKVLAGTFAQLDAVVKKYDGDMAKAIADPDGRAAVEAMGSERDAAANAAIHHYFAIGCTQN